MKTIKSIDMNSSQLKNVASPSANTDAANKAYVDAAITTAGVSGELVVTDEGDYYSIDIAAGATNVSMTDQGDYVTLSVN